FSTPHGGGGPGSGPVGVRAGLEQFLPNPRVMKDDMDHFYVENNDKSLGFISGFLGNFAVMMRAYTYILTLGYNNIKNVGPLATLNANYIKESLKDCYELPIGGVCKHEFVFDGLKDKSTGVTTLDVAKRLLDYGFHSPTIYFPLLFHEALMIEPTENESKETLDGFIEVMKTIAREAKEDPEMVKSAPHNTPVRRLDDTQAALHPIVTYRELQAEAL
ncbi:MAG: aminomethyl-transferring glycine dehydrogenase subunit GcvPB, partial [Muribaculaceae bacterium]|nr:aminomethyl-transferring glycine dehydrogenase subunit GcvPB [Muribaculaceae bacterium]